MDGALFLFGGQGFIVLFLFGLMCAVQSNVAPVMVRLELAVGRQDWGWLGSWCH